MQKRVSRLTATYQWICQCLMIACWSRNDDFTPVKDNWLVVSLFECGCGAGDQQLSHLYVPLVGGMWCFVFEIEERSLYVVAGVISFLLHALVLDFMPFEGHFNVWSKKKKRTSQWHNILGICNSIQSIPSVTHTWIFWSSFLCKAVCSSLFDIILYAFANIVWSRKTGSHVYHSCFKHWII